MPTQFSNLDTGFPSFTGKESTEQKLEALHNYTYMLLESLRYILRNIGPENLNRTEMDGYVTEFTDPLHVLIKDETERATEAETEISVEAGNIKAQVTDEYGNWVVLTLRGDGLHIGNASGTTTIDGDNITTGTITGDRIKANQTIEAPNIVGGTITGAILTSTNGGAGQFQADIVKIADGEIEFWYGNSKFGEISTGDGTSTLHYRTANGRNMRIETSGDLVLDSPLVLASGKNYGSQLPPTGTPGQLFFLI